ncbi:MAG: SusC/RagA family TonB-linked outer membrane protein, partial [Flavobacteriales bacterium]
MFYQTGFIRNTNVSLSGGGQGGMTYHFSGGYYDEDGIIKATGFTRYNTRLNLQARALKEKLFINPIIFFSRSNRARGNGSNSAPLSLGAGNMPSSLLNLSAAKRDLFLGTYDANNDENVDNQLNVGINLGYEFSKKFQFTSQSNYIGNNARRDLSVASALQNYNGNSASSFSSNVMNLRTNNYLSYIDTYGKHNLNVVVGQEASFNQTRISQMSAFQGVSDAIQVVGGFQQRNTYASSDYQSNGFASYYGRISYDFDSKYIIGLTGRADGSSRFGKNNKWGFFPSASAAWLLSEENFFKDKFKAFSLLKIRGSIGLTGNSNMPNYLQYSLYNVNAGYYYGNDGATSYNGVTAITPNFFDGVAQDNISWERSMQWNFGTDMELNNGKYTMSFDVYNKENTLQLFSVALPVTTGYDRALTNSIGVRNSGAELAFSANPLPSKSLIKWNTRFNISYNKNAIMSLPNGGRDLVLSGGRFDKSHILSVGSPINAFYLYRTRGVFATDNDVPVNPHTGDRYGASGNAFRAGDFYLADLDGDYNIDPFNDGINPDKVPMGDPNPKWTGGFTNNITYKNFSLNVFCTFTFDRDVLNLFESDQFSNSASSRNNFANFSTADLDRLNIWRKSGDQAQYAKYDIDSRRYYYVSSQSFFLEKGGYFRIKSVMLNYQLNQNIVKRLGLGAVKFYAVADNV